MLLAMAGGVGAGGDRSARVFGPLGPDFRVGGPYATADDGDAAVAWNGSADEYLVVWWDERNEGTSGSDIYGRRVGAGGG
jgi:hypothetical protein